MKHILDDNRVSHFWSTSWSPIDACYIPFQSSGSQQSNASNGAQFGVETKKLQPLQVNHSKLKEAFCKVLRNHPFVAKWFHESFSQAHIFRYCHDSWVELLQVHRFPHHHFSGVHVRSFMHPHGVIFELLGQIGYIWFHTGAYSFL